jgi:transposase
MIATDFRPWCVQVMRSWIEPMKKVARMLRRHRPLILNWLGELTERVRTC